MTLIREMPKVSVKLDGKVTVKLDGKYVLFREVNVSINETATSSRKPLDIQLTLENGEVIYDDGSRVEVITRT